MYVQTLAMIPTVSFPTTVIIVLFIILCFAKQKYAILCIKQKEQLIQLLFCISYHLSSDDTVNFLRPRRRRAANTRRPLGVDMRSRKPCLLRRLRCDGWNVLFISRYFYIFPVTFWECKGSIFVFNCKIFLIIFSFCACVSPFFCASISRLQQG